MFGIGPIELIVVFVVALLVFGPAKLPELARTLGKGLREFRNASSELRRSIEIDDHDHRPPAPAQTGSPHEAPEPGSALDEVESARLPSPDPDATTAEDGAQPASDSQDESPETNEAVPANVNPFASRGSETKVDPG